MNHKWVVSCRVLLPARGGSAQGLRAQALKSHHEFESYPHYFIEIWPWAPHCLLLNLSSDLWSGRKWKQMSLRMRGDSHSRAPSDNLGTAAAVISSLASFCGVPGSETAFPRGTFIAWTSPFYIDFCFIVRNVPMCCNHRSFFFFLSMVMKVLREKETRFTVASLWGLPGLTEGFLKSCH